MFSYHGYSVLFFVDTKLQQKKPHVKGFNSNSLKIRPHLTLSPQTVPD